MKGKAYLLGNNVSGDQIISGSYLSSGKPAEELIGHLFEDLRPDFSEKYTSGDIIVAGENFGCGSSRELAMTLMKTAGIGCVVARSFSRNFYRNGINLGILPIECSAVIADGDTVEIDMDTSCIIVNSLDKYSFVPFPPQIMGYIREGSLVEYYKKHGGLS